MELPPVRQWNQKLIRLPSYLCLELDEMVFRLKKADRKWSQNRVFYEALKFWMGAVKRKESKALRAREKNAAL